MMKNLYITDRENKAYLLTQSSANIMVHLNWHFKEIFLRFSRAYALQPNITEPVFPIIYHLLSCDANIAQY